MWHHGSIVVDGKTVSYECKVYAEPSNFGIDGGKISKLRAMCDGKTIIHYDRGWGLLPQSGFERSVLETIINKYN